MTDTKTKAQTIAQIMMQAQVFATAWATTDSPFDYEESLADAERERDKLRALVTAALAQQSAQQVASVPTRDEIRAIFLANGFTLKHGDDLRPYVYDAAYALIQRVLETPPISAAQPSNQPAQQEKIISKLKKELEAESRRLAACGIVAKANTRELAARIRREVGDYWSLSCDDVAQAVDKQMELREQLDAIDAARKGGINV